MKDQGLGLLRPCCPYDFTPVESVQDYDTVWFECPVCERQWYFDDFTAVDDRNRF